MYSTRKYNFTKYLLAPGTRPYKGTFVTNEGNKFANQDPFVVDDGVYVFGAYESGWFRMFSLNSFGGYIAERHSSRSMTHMMSQSEIAQIWNNANSGGCGYRVTNVEFCGRCLYICT